MGLRRAGVWEEIGGRDVDNACCCPEKFISKADAEFPAWKNQTCEGQCRGSFSGGGCFCTVTEYGQRPIGWTEGQHPVLTHMFADLMS
mmetsp:Transcript_88070/g.146483  ORF Transcript_88070/g.146483 Transcript_88070/m.146483 type:complete len:88 (-) Transcript_88070:83-346(-)